MATTEETRNDLYQGLTEALGKQRANTLMEHLPPRGWADVATKQDLQLLRNELQTEIGELRAEMRVGFADVRTELHRTLRTHTLAMMATTTALIGLLGGFSRSLG